MLTGHKLPKETLHPAIREDVWSLYHRGKYDTAVFEAMKAVEVSVRDASIRLSLRIGTKTLSLTCSRNRLGIDHVTCKIEHLFGEL